MDGMAHEPIAHEPIAPCQFMFSDVLNSNECYVLGHPLLPFKEMTVDGSTYRETLEAWLIRNAEAGKVMKIDNIGVEAHEQGTD